MSGDTLRTALSVAHASRIGHDGQCSGVFGRCASWDEVEATIATPTGKALADVVAAAEALHDEYGIRGTPVPSQSREGELVRAIDRLREATDEQ